MQEYTDGKEFMLVSDNFSTYLSIEPLIAEPFALPPTKWVIVGAETGNRKNKVIPKREWIEHIVNECKMAGIPIFLKNSLASIWGERLIQEFPWEI